jgi:TPR repeat protein
MYYEGEGVEKNKSRAYRLFRQSAEQGNSDAEKALQN